MIVGILSDTHDRLGHIRKAVEVFNRSGAAVVLHAGDYVAPFALNPFERLEMDWMGVFGNNDGELAGLAAFSGGRISGRRLERELGGRRFILVHDPAHVRAGGRYPPGADVVVFGHTHESLVERAGPVLLVNPGECCAYLGNRATVALLDTDNLEVEFVELVP